MASACESRDLPIGISTVDGGAGTPRPLAGSCATATAGTSDCGPDGESCCVAPLVSGGQYLRSYDGVTFTDPTHPATVSAFRLDKYEVTVGRFRQFVAATVAGWSPAPGSGVHASPPGGVFDANTGQAETGWSEGWNGTVYHTKDAWNGVLACFEGSEWTPDPGANERLPIGCLTWFQAYAFCIWDGGYLPTEAEWNFAAAGGEDQRVYPWSVPSTSSTIDCSYANVARCAFDVVPVGSRSPKGDGRWGQADLAGNINEWTLDELADYPLPCQDCARVTGEVPSTTRRVIRGGTLQSEALVVVSTRFSADPHAAGVLTGVRCARSPR